MDEATLSQTRAAQPGVSTWLSANAGSGKTRVLTDRVARLLLDGVSPQNILCLTYTKAAASEMQNRLFQRLGEWSMAPDADLANKLQVLGITDTDAAQLANARRLFARAIETPGGLRIQTIHSFCAALLRRFPLEAEVAPSFTEMDDRAGALLCDTVLNDLAEAQPDLLDDLARHITTDDLMPLLSDILRNQDSLRRTEPREISGSFGLADGFSPTDIIAACFDGSEPGLVTQVSEVCKSQSKTYQSFAENLRKLDLKSPQMVDYRALCDLFLYKSGDKANQSKSSNYPQSSHKKAVEAFAPIAPDLHDFMDRVAAARQLEFRHATVNRTLSLHRFAQAFLDRYTQGKQARGWLDFDDLILKTRALLSDPAVAAWVLYRLDGGLDHILVDEAQDTSPTQWQVIERLAQEFTAGQGARDDTPRTIFVVGDKKQSIYSFQGADPREFDRMRDHFKERLSAIDAPFQRMELEYSFRSSDAILRFVDRCVPIPEMRHRAFHAELPGRVDLWPALPKTAAPEKEHWYDPVDIVTADHEDVVLSQRIAGQIYAMLAQETLPTTKGRRKIQPGDIMILVRRRSTLFEEIIRACKARGLPVAGADRLKLGAELAVKDIAAVLAFLATPEDDLSLAAALKSPLFDWSEDMLFRLAQGRKGYLWEALRNQPEHQATTEVLDDLRANADFLRPYDLIERILTRHDGRRRLLARLGAEAEDGIDALLTQALSYERNDVPSLTGFLSWLQTDEVEIKRQMDSAGNLIRVMTVHGAKGLEAPIVILPDTAKRRKPMRDPIIHLPNGVPIWKPPSDAQPTEVSLALDAMGDDSQAEENRLFYVAATRAENWLIVAAAGDTGENYDSWHSVAALGLQDLGAVEFDTPVGPGLRYAHGVWGAGDVKPTPPSAASVIHLPEWAKTRAETPDRPAQTLSPSNLGGAKALPGDAGEDPEIAMQHGTDVHLLLEHLPGLGRDEWASFAKNNDISDAALAEAQGVLTDPRFHHIFAPDTLAEVDLTANLPELGGARINGTLDRLIITDQSVLAVDFKTNAVVPDSHGQTPIGVLRQMGAYLAALEQIFPGHQITVAILWSRTPCLMPLPHEIVRSAVQNTPRS